MTADQIKKATEQVELVAIALAHMVDAHCKMQDGSLCSMCNEANEQAMYALADIGMVKIVDERPGMITGVWVISEEENGDLRETPEIQGDAKANVGLQNVPADVEREAGGAQEEAGPARPADGP